ncbi:MAG: hypothetical protein A2147_00990 [Chloroflexi bacterium RBG_16_57_8]|nr:MAG: hypothetical protein A2147_00990 [Chloroflexi bacterium RBG_16_57_8]
MMTFERIGSFLISRRRRAALCLVIATLAGLGTVSVAVAKKVFEADKGPKTIDVSGYPKPYQERYKLFSKRCSKCHTLARPINTNFEPSKWEKYVKRMMRKKDSGIKSEEGEKIWQFLMFDTKERKKPFWEKLAEDEKKLIEESIKKVLSEN